MHPVQNENSTSSTKRGLGVCAAPAGIAWTLVSALTLDGIAVEEEREISPPANLKLRGEQLDWLFEEIGQVLRRLQPDMIVVEKPGMGFARERAEIEGLILVAAHRARVPLEMLTKDSCRARLGRPAGKGAFKMLLDEEDVKVRSNGARRERYVFGKTALRLTGVT